MEKDDVASQVIGHCTLVIATHPLPISLKLPRHRISWLGLPDLSLPSPASRDKGRVVVGRIDSAGRIVNDRDHDLLAVF